MVASNHLCHSNRLRVCCHTQTHAVWWSILFNAAINVNLCPAEISSLCVNVLAVEHASMLCQLLSPQAIPIHRIDSTDLSRLIDNPTPTMYISAKPNRQKRRWLCMYIRFRAIALCVCVAIYVCSNYIPHSGCCAINAICFVLFFLSFSAWDCYFILRYCNDGVWNPYNCRWIFQCGSAGTIILWLHSEAIMYCRPCAIEYILKSDDTDGPDRKQKCIRIPTVTTYTIRIYMYNIIYTYIFYFRK